jgi:hypothetical protein
MENEHKNNFDEIYVRNKGSQFVVFLRGNLNDQII